jgi:glutathione S-transferase
MMRSSGSQHHRFASAAPARRSSNDGAAAAPATTKLRVVAARATTLYTNPGSRGKIVEWYLAERGLQDAVKTVNIDMKSGEHKKPDYLKLHPFGQVPVLDDDGVRCAVDGFGGG